MSRYINGELHSVNGEPAIEYYLDESLPNIHYSTLDPIGTEYYNHGKRHREDGPALWGNEDGNDYVEYWLNGELVEAKGHPATDEYQEELKRKHQKNEAKLADALEEDVNF